MATVLLICLMSRAIAVPPPAVDLHFRAGQAKSDALEAIVADDQVNHGSETRDQGMEINTSSVCRLIIDTWAGSGANAILEIDGLPTSNLETYQSFAYVKPLRIVRPGSAGGFYQHVIVLDAVQNYMWLWLHINKGESHGPIHVLVIGTRCPH